MKFLFKIWRYLFPSQPTAAEMPATAASLPSNPVAHTPVRVSGVSSPEERQARRERRLKQTEISRFRNKVAASANAILDRFSSLSARGVQSSDRVAIRDYERVLTKFNHTDLLLFDHLDDGWGAFDPDGMEQELIEAVWPLNFGAVLRMEREGMTPHYKMMHVASEDPRNLRGRIKIVPSKIVNVLDLSIYDDGNWYAQETPTGFINGRWRILDAGLIGRRVSGVNVSENVRRVSEKIADEIHDAVSVFQSAAFTERYSWHASMGFKTGPRLLLPTNPSGCLDLFRNRGIGGDATRRAALRHWVRNHYRGASSGDEITYVRDHLRGATDFDWCGLGCRLLVSEFDLEKNEAFRLEAEQWRAARGHNRVKVRVKR